MPTKKDSVVDQMAEDANAVPPEYPEGMPALTPWMLLFPYSRRGAFKRKFSTFRDSQDKMNAAKEAGVFEDVEEDALTPELQEARMNASADADDMFDLMYQLMEMCADDPAAFQAWARQAGEDGLSKAFSTLMARSQLGEVSSSTS